ncbi:MAG: hypothetical protein E7170_01675 [Firmicutes bacterium]|nr:hypothetical protein [Bacillota bacterium]
MNNKGFAISSIIYAILILFLALIVGILGLLGNRKIILDKLKDNVIAKINNEEIYKPIYKDNSGASVPELSEGFIPVIYDGTNWIYADIHTKWYDYDLKEWANAVMLKKDVYKSVGDVILDSEIDGYFVWIPRYKYKIFNSGIYTSYISNTKPTLSSAHEIEIVFEHNSTPKSNGSEIGEYLTHPAFTFGAEELNGIWVGKYETSGTVDDVNIIPNAVSLRNVNVKTMFELSYNYNRDLDSHMMKNTEWGAVSYLSHSKYGINSEIRINNSSAFITGCAATTSALNYVGVSQKDGSEGYFAGCENAYNTEIGGLASTTGNITGVYDMSGGAWEYVAAYANTKLGSSGFDTSTISAYNNKYFDIYPSNSDIGTYSYRILGDATGEMGPFYYYEDSDGTTRYHSSWYSDNSNFIGSTYPWFNRGGHYYNGVISGSFRFSRNTGEALDYNTFRIVLK